MGLPSQNHIDHHRIVPLGLDVCKQKELTNHSSWFPLTCRRGIKQVWKHLCWPTVVGRQNLLIFYDIRTIYLTQQCRLIISANFCQSCVMPLSQISKIRFRQIRLNMVSSEEKLIDSIISLLWSSSWWQLLQSQQLNGCVHATNAMRSGTDQWLVDGEGKIHQQQWHSHEIDNQGNEMPLSFSERQSTLAQLGASQLVPIPTRTQYQVVSKLTGTQYQLVPKQHRPVDSTELLLLCNLTYGTLN